MTPEFLCRLQFALTASFHFIFPPIPMGLGVFRGKVKLTADSY